MGDAYGWGAGDRQVFDAELLEKAASRLREQKKDQLVMELQQGLMPTGAFGQIAGAQEASGRLIKLFEGMGSELTKAGIDLDDLASRSLAAAELARQADVQTQSAARNMPR
ncbi:hypothetical protein LWC34_01925 [Kibdelosporangium philippinense]|uniref:Uncharacterized protein n=1 Tax=Kibdelosporangium philippinense TaxID=211113 RepID=A0ABS8Z0W7_9PSEU|nr:hypothetical protein [Kibdelosporangium philippinense]MCE7001606.1 hypothetical protein [Kibdelosporangium philippinense]